VHFVGRDGVPTYISYEPVCCNSSLIFARCGSTALAAARPRYVVAALPLILPTAVLFRPVGRYNVRLT
jgi:hypothetical protein